MCVSLIWKHFPFRVFGAYPHAETQIPLLVRDLIQCHTLIQSDISYLQQPLSFCILQLEHIPCRELTLRGNTRLVQTGTIVAVPITPEQEQPWVIVRPFQFALNQNILPCGSHHHNTCWYQLDSCLLALGTGNGGAQEGERVGTCVMILVPFDEVFLRLSPLIKIDGWVNSWSSLIFYPIMISGSLHQFLISSTSLSWFIKTRSTIYFSSRRLVPISPPSTGFSGRPTTSATSLGFSSPAGPFSISSNNLL